jgi:hypothetical protein
LNPLTDVELRHHNKRGVIINLRDYMYLFVKLVQARQMPEGITSSRTIQAYWAGIIRIFHLVMSGGWVRVKLGPLKSLKHKKGNAHSILGKD